MDKIQEEVEKCAAVYAEKCTQKPGAERTKRQVAFANGAYWAIENIDLLLKLMTDETSNK